jgi:hypothetical protein
LAALFYGGVELHPWCHLRLNPEGLVCSTPCDRPGTAMPGLQGLSGLPTCPPGQNAGPVKCPVKRPL